MVRPRRAVHDASMDTTMTPPAEPSPPPPRAEQPGEPPAPPRRLVRSRNDRWVAGVAGGVAETYGFEPWLVRGAFGALALVTFGTAAVAYVVAWIVVPEADADEPILASAVRRTRRRPPDFRWLIGFFLLLCGASMLADRFGMWRFGRLFWPVSLIIAGGALLMLRERDADLADASTPPEAAPPEPAQAESTRPEPSATADPTGTTVTMPAFEPTEPSDSSAPPAPPGPPVPPVPPVPASAYPPSLPWPEPPRPRLPRVRRERSMLGRLTWSALFVVAGAAWLVDVTGAAAVDLRFVLALELVVVGVALFVGSWFGRSRGLIALGLVLTFFAGAFAALDVPLRGDIGQRVVRPASVAALESKYHLGIGLLQIDLRDTALDGRPHRLALTDAMGFIEVFVPTDARVQVKARSDIGSVDVFGRPEVGGTNADINVVDDPAGASGARIFIDAHVGFGAVKVTREPPSLRRLDTEVSG
jgi:phage shock protein PspC (stress-responsive transcriptional regulator)